MSGALAIAGVTAAIKDLLNDGLVDHDLSSVGSFSVTAQPPDRITTGGSEANQLNLFLYQVTPNMGWRNADLPARDARGGRISNPPLALDLHYLLSAYGAQDLNAEVLLGFAMQLLHETPVLTREQLRIALGAPSPIDGSLLPGPFGNLSALDLADQVELIKITPEYLGAEELSKLWTAMQARFRPSMGYLATVVLIRSEGGARSAPPVLKRGAEDRGPIARGTPAPVLSGYRNLASPLLPGARLGDDIALAGTNLAGEGVAVRFTAQRLGIVNLLPPAPGAGPSELRVHLPTPAEQAGAMAGWAPGFYGVALSVSDPDGPGFAGEEIVFALAPRIVATPLAAAANTPQALTVTCEPRLRPGQEVGARLFVGSLEVLPDSVTTPADESQPSSLVFTVPGLPAGKHLLRLRIDGIDSLPVVIGGTPPGLDFDPAQMLSVA